MLKNVFLENTMPGDTNLRFFFKFFSSKKSNLKPNDGLEFLDPFSWGVLFSFHMMIWRKYIWSADIDFGIFAIRKHVFVRISEYFDRLNHLNFRLRQAKKTGVFEKLTFFSQMVGNFVFWDAKQDFNCVRPYRK